MNLEIAHRFAAVTRTLPAATLWQLRRAVPQYRARAQGLDDPEFLYRLALAVVQPLAGAAAPAKLDTMAFYLVAVAGMAEAERGAPDALRAKIDSISEVSEMDMLRLQMAMDRLSKLQSTLSNLLKKQSETASTITQNLK